MKLACHPISASGKPKLSRPAIGIERERRAVGRTAVTAIDPDNATRAGDLHPIVLGVMLGDDLKIR